MDPVTSPSTGVRSAHAAEQDRLLRLDALLNGPCLRALGVSGGERVLEVGPGLGVLSRGLARAAPDVRVVGVERDGPLRDAGLRLAAAAGEAGLVEVRSGDPHALPLEPLEWGSFDLAVARCVVEQSSTPGRIVGEMARAVRPGGRVALIDHDHALLRVHPEVDGLDEVWSAFCETLQRLDLDPWIGRRLPALLREAGLEVRRSTWIFLGGCASEERFDLAGRSLADRLAGARGQLLAQDAVAPDRLDAVLEGLRAWRERPDAALWYGACYAEARRPCGAGFTLTP